MKYLILMLKGFIIGVAKIIPGVSGAVLSISLGVYERLLEVIGHPFKININDIKFLFFLLFGAGSGILLFCNGLKWCLNNYYIPTMLLFVGLIIGGMPEIFADINKKDYNFLNLFIFFISFFIILIIANLSSNSNSFNNNYFLMGSIESLTTIVPGISGTAVFMALGWYEKLLDTINSILTFNCSIDICFSFISGFVISTIFIAKFLDFILEKYRCQTFFCVIGFMFGSLWSLLASLIKYNFNFINLFVGVLLFIIGFLLTLKINIFFSKF